MVKISVLYPNQPGSRFDFDYYVKTHMPMAAELLNESGTLRGLSVERGLSGGQPGSAPPYWASCHFLFDSLEAFLAAFAPHAPALQGDIPNYTDVAPVIQVGEVALTR